MSKITELTELAVADLADDDLLLVRDTSTNIDKKIKGAAVTGKANKPSSPTAGNLASLDANGNLEDSRIAKTNVLKFILATGRATDGNALGTEIRSLSFDLVSSSMTTGKPRMDGYVLTMAWDRDKTPPNNYRAQLFVGDDGKTIGTRQYNPVNNNWTAWEYYSPNCFKQATVTNNEFDIDTGHSGTSVYEIIATQYDQIHTKAGHWIVNFVGDLGNSCEIISDSDGSNKCTFTSIGNTLHGVLTYNCNELIYRKLR